MKDSYIGENIRFYRERSDFTQQELADKVGVTWEMISRYERNASSPLNKLSKISRALNISPSQLLEEHIPSNQKDLSFRVPLIVSIKSGDWFSEKFSNFYYFAPEWIFQENIKAIAIDASLVMPENPTDDKSGVYYICPPEHLKLNDKIIINKTDFLMQKEFNGRKQEGPIIGKLIAREIRY